MQQKIRVFDTEKFEKHSDLEKEIFEYRYEN